PVAGPAGATVGAVVVPADAVGEGVVPDAVGDGASAATGEHAESPRPAAAHSHARRFESGELPERLRGPCGKAARHLARLSLVLHCARMAGAGSRPSVIAVDDVEAAAI